MKGIFIAGTDTGVGKTIVAGLLARFLKQQGVKVVTQKWIQTGSKKYSQDLDLHLKLMKTNRNSLKFFLPWMCPYIFKLLASPHLAAACENKVIRGDKIKASYKGLAKNFDFVIVEGIGGATVPFSPKKLVIDLAKDLKLPVLIVVSNKLGAINHTLLTIEALRRRKIKILGLIFNNIDAKCKKQIIIDNPKIIKSLSGEKILGTLPWLENKEQLYKKFIPIGRKINSGHINSGHIPFKRPQNLPYQGESF